MHHIRDWVFAQSPLGSHSRSGGSRIDAWVLGYVYGREIEPLSNPRPDLKRNGS
jgi:hypothetical protein